VNAIIENNKERDKAAAAAAENLILSFTAETFSTRYNE
jgi:hypothetical protein